MPVDGQVRSADDMALEFYGTLGQWAANVLNAADPGIFLKNGGIDGLKDATVIFRGREEETGLAFYDGLRAGLARAMETGESVAATIILPPRGKSPEAIRVSMVFVPCVTEEIWLMAT